MSPLAVARFLRLYPADWRERYGAEFAALLESHPLSARTAVDVLRGVWEVHMTSSEPAQRQSGALQGAIWYAWMLAVAAGMLLLGMVDDSPLVAAMNGNWLFLAGWLGVQTGAAVAGAAIVLSGAPMAWSMLRYAVSVRRGDILARLALPLIGALVLAAWVVSIVLWTGGRWGASPWAVAISRPDWPAAGFRWITGSITALLLIAVLAASAVGIAQALRRTEFPDVQLAWPGGELRIQPLRFAAWLAPWAAAGCVVMSASIVLWGLAAIRIASGALSEPGGPLGLTNFSAWIASVLLFVAAAALSVRAARRFRHLRFPAD